MGYDELRLEAQRQQQRLEEQRQSERAAQAQYEARRAMEADFHKKEASNRCVNNDGPAVAAGGLCNGCATTARLEAERLEAEANQARSTLLGADPGLTDLGLPEDTVPRVEEIQQARPNRSSVSAWDELFPIDRTNSVGGGRDLGSPPNAEGRPLGGDDGAPSLGETSRQWLRHSMRDTKATGRESDSGESREWLRNESQTPTAEHPAVPRPGESARVSLRETLRPTSPGQEAARSRRSSSDASVEHTNTTSITHEGGNAHRTAAQHVDQYFCTNCQTICKAAGLCPACGYVLREADRQSYDELMSPELHFVDPAYAVDMREYPGLQAMQEARRARLGEQPTGEQTYLSQGEWTNQPPDSLSGETSRHAKAETALGYGRDQELFWRDLLRNHEKLFSAKNRRFIEAGHAPEVDKTWLKYHPGQKFYRHDKLVHHHWDQGPWAFGVPESFHVFFTKLLHPLRYPDEL